MKNSKGIKIDDQDRNIVSVRLFMLIGLQRKYTIHLNGFN